MSELSVGLNEDELVLQLFGMSASMLNKFHLLWLAINKAEINTEATSGPLLSSRKRSNKESFSFYPPT